MYVLKPYAMLRLWFYSHRLLSHNQDGSRCKVDVCTPHTWRVLLLLVFVLILGRFGHCRDMFAKIAADFRGHCREHSHGYCRAHCRGRCLGHCRGYCGGQPWILRRTTVDIAADIAVDRTADISTNISADISTNIAADIALDMTVDMSVVTRGIIC